MLPTHRIFYSVSISVLLCNHYTTANKTRRKRFHRQGCLKYLCATTYFILSLVFVCIVIMSSSEDSGSDDSECNKREQGTYIHLHAKQPRRGNLSIFLMPHSVTSTFVTSHISYILKSQFCTILSPIVI